MFMLRNASKPLKIQIQELAEELDEIGQMRDLSAEDLNLVAGGLYHQCIAGHGVASDM